MTGLLSSFHDRDLRVPPGSVLIRADALTLDRPGAGGYAAIIQNDAGEIRLVCGGLEMCRYEQIADELTRKLAEQIGRKRAVIIVRAPALYRHLSEKFAKLPLITLAGRAPLFVADATRHAHVAAERASITGENFEPPIAIIEPVTAAAGSEEAADVANAKLEQADVQEALTLVSALDLTATKGRDPHFAHIVQTFLDRSGSTYLHRQYHRLAHLFASAGPAPKPAG